MDVLLTHSTCSSDVAASLKVKVHAWGHVHERFGVNVLDLHSRWLDVCACSVDGDYAHTHGAVVVDVPHGVAAASPT